MSVKEQLNKPIFRVTSLKREFLDAYQILGLGFALGFGCGWLF